MLREFADVAIDSPRPLNSCTRRSRARTSPTLAGVRAPFAAWMVEGTTPMRLARIMRQADIGLSLEYMQLAETMEERDAHYSAVLGTRKRSVSQLPLSVEPIHDDAEHNKHADFLREWLKTGVLEMALFNQADAIGKGYSVLEIDWDVGPKQIVPKALTWRPQRYFEIDQKDGDTVLLRGDEGVLVDLSSGSATRSVRGTPGATTRD